MLHDLRDVWRKEADEWENIPHDADDPWLFIALADLRELQSWLIYAPIRSPIDLAIKIEITAHYEDWRTPEQMRLLEDALQLLEAA